MKKISLIGCCTTLVLLAGCGTYEVNKVNVVQPTDGNDFTKALTTEYRDYANYEAKVEFEWPHAAHFAHKGLDAAKGVMVDPDVLVTDNNMGHNDLPPARLEELSAARTRLLGYFADGSRERVPEASAKAQVKFDCWFEEEMEGDVNSDCRAEFLKTEPLLKPVAAIVAQLPKIVRTYNVYFDFNKADLTNAAHKIVKEVVAAEGQIHPLNIYLSGHADTVGSSDYNDALSQKRVRVVGDALAKLGVKTTVLDMKSYGERKLLVQTKDETKEAKNRCVEVNFEK